MIIRNVANWSPNDTTEENKQEPETTIMEGEKSWSVVKHEQKVKS
jgi:hypothetical protein